MLSSQLTRIVSMMAPRRAAAYAARRRFASVRRDQNNFTHPDQLAALVAPYRLVSFDLFDTLIWRSISSDDVHLKTAEFGERIIRGDDGPLPPGLLLHCRHRHQDAVKAAHMRSGDAYRNEIDLADVFDSALAPYLADPARRARAVAALVGFELRTERMCLVPDPVMRDFVAALRAAGKMVILTSDMYLTEEGLRPILADHGLEGMFDRIYVSASVGVTKHSGLMFDHIDDDLGSHDWRRLHLGDNWVNDVILPRRHGWDALHYLNPENETRKARLDHETRLGAHSLPGAVRALVARIESGDPDRALQRLVAAGFVSFARQVLAAACRDRVDRVLFLTRDGTIYRHLLDRMIAESGAGDLDLPPFEELAFSRRAGVLLTCPPIASPDWPDYIRFNVRWMRDEEPTLGGICRTFALDPAALAPGADPDLPLEDLIDDPNLSGALDRALQDRRGRVVDYLDQQGIFDRDERLLLVDIGYSGTVLKSLTEHAYAREAEGLPVRSRMRLMMFAANRFFATNLNRLHPRITMADPVMIGRADWRHRAAAFNFAWLEPFAVDRTRGSLRDYRADDAGRLQPVFGPGGDDAARRSLLDDASAVGRLLRLSPVSDAVADRAISDAIARRFAHPRRDTLRGVDGLTHQAGLTEYTEDGLLTRVRPWRLRSDLSRCLAEDRWVQGSMAASRMGWLNPLLNRVIGLISR